MDSRSRKYNEMIALRMIKVMKRFMFKLPELPMSIIIRLLKSGQLN